MFSVPVFDHVALGNLLHFCNKSNREPHRVLESVIRTIVGNIIFVNLERVTVDD